MDNRQYIDGVQMFRLILFPLMGVARLMSRCKVIKHGSSKDNVIVPVVFVLTGFSSGFENSVGTLKSNRR